MEKQHSSSLSSPFHLPAPICQEKGRGKIATFPLGSQTFRGKLRGFCFFKKKIGESSICVLESNNSRTFGEKKLKIIVRRKREESIASFEKPLHIRACLQETNLQPTISHISFSKARKKVNCNGAPCTKGNITIENHAMSAGAVFPLKY